MGFQFKKVAILGVGLMGGSLGLALRKRGIAQSVIGLGRNLKRLAQAKKKGAIDFGTTDWIQGVSQADLVVICTPVCKIIPAVKDLLQHFPKDCIITDVGSTKKSIVDGIEKLINKRKNEIFFVGSHPMAGSEQFGIEAATINLYENSLCLITPTINSNRKAVAKVSKVWKSVGCNVLKLPPDIHDKSVAAVSHLPHVLASVLVNTIARNDHHKMNLTKIASRGFRDTTRIASSHPEIWTDICLENKESVLETIQWFKRELNEMELNIKKENSKELYNKFSTAKKFRDKLNTA